MNRRPLSHTLASIACVALTGVVAGAADAESLFGSFAPTESPAVIGRRVVDNFLPRPYLPQWEDTVIHYAEACAWWGALVFADNFWVSIVWMAVALIGVNGARAIFWTIPPRFLTGVAAAGGLAFINSIGTTGGFVGPTIMGWLTDRTGSYSAGLLAMSGFLLLAAGLAASLKLLKHGE